jgi:Transcription factor DP
MGIISKDKKEIIWIGLPRSLADTADDDDADAAPTVGDDVDEEEEEEAPAHPLPATAVAAAAAATQPRYSDAAEYTPQELEAMERERDYLESEVARKQESLKEILIQQVCFRNLVMRNQHHEYPTRGGPHVPPPADEKIPLPFIICNTKPTAVLRCDMNKEKNDVMFEFDSPFEINDDNTILKRMKM